jgi:hypothetical protein
MRLLLALMAGVGAAAVAIARLFFPPSQSGALASVGGSTNEATQQTQQARSSGRLAELESADRKIKLLNDVEIKSWEAHREEDETPTMRGTQKKKRLN